MNARCRQQGLVEDPSQDNWRDSHGLVLLPRPASASDQSNRSEARLIEEVIDRLSARSHTDISKMLTQFRAEREQLDEAILALERLARRRTPAAESGSKRRRRSSGGKNKPGLNPVV